MAHDSGQAGITLFDSRGEPHPLAFASVVDALSRVGSPEVTTLEAEAAADEIFHALLELMGPNKSS